MTPIRLCSAVLVGACFLTAAGCGKGPDEGFTSYDHLQQDPAPAVPAEAAAKPPEAPATVPAATAASPEEPAIAELPLLVEGIAGNAVASADEPAIAEGPEDVLIAAASPRRIELLIPNHKFRKSRQGALWVTYDDIDLLKVLNMEPVPTDAPDMMPDWLKRLDGKRVHVRGYMYPIEQATGITNFVLARDNQICCFGRFPKVYDLINITMKEGESTDYVQGAPIDVVGTFHILPSITLSRLYRIDDAVVVER
jgi:hypothetical protein